MQPKYKIPSEICLKGENMEEITITLNASKLLPGVMPPQALRVTVDENGLTNLIRINGPRMINIGEGPLEGVARTLLRVSTGAIPEFKQEEMSIISDSEKVMLSTPGSGLQIIFERAGLEELACRLILIHRDMTGSLLEKPQNGIPLHEIPIGKLVNNFNQEVEDIDLL
jgi:hypothetical protein